MKKDAGKTGMVKMPMGGIDKSTTGTGESMTPQNFKGGPTDISHSISNGKAVQGRDKGGKTDRFS